jgi:hypothetical protein
VIDAAAAWQALPPPSSPLTWSAVAVSPLVRVAKTPSGGAAILVRSHVAIEDEYGLRTAYVSYEPRRELQIEGTKTESGVFRVLECQGDDLDLLKHFLRLVRTLDLVDTTPVAFDSEVRSLFELFRALVGRGTGTAQGLWAELALISAATDPSHLVQAWHSDPDDLHDFVGNGDHLEVKSTTRNIREHEFSLEQLERAPDKTIIASMLLREDAAGPSVFDLLDHLSSRVEQKGLRQRAEAIVATTLGEGWREATEVRFDLGHALASLSPCGAADVPRVLGPVPAAVRRVRFTADLSAVPTCRNSGAHRLWAAAMPVIHTGTFA